ncbi:hypothetical protein ACYVVI_11725 [Arenicellales bacterium IMCC57338]
MLAKIIPVLLLGFHCLAPGWAVSRLWPIKGCQLGISFGLSLAILFLSYALFSVFRLDTNTWLTSYYSLSLVLIVYALKKIRFTLPKKARNFLSTEPEKHFGLVLITILYSVYFAIAGPYTELPSDYWQHVYRSQAHLLEILQTSPMGVDRPLPQLAQSPSPYYFFVALLASFLSQNSIYISGAFSLFFSLSFILSIYLFSHLLSTQCFESKTYRAVAALTSAIITSLWMGTASFAYIRYYAFSPGIISMTLLFVVFGVLISTQRSGVSRQNLFFILVPLLLSIGIIHKQELLFFAVITPLLLVMTYGRPGLISNRRPYLPKPSLVWILFSLSFVVIAMIPVLNGHNINNWGFTPHVIDIGAVFGINTSVPIVNPLFRPWDTIGLFGVVVLLWYYIERRQFRSLVFLKAGLLIPVLTCFNPLFVWIFLHYAGSSVAWRFMYLMPLGIIAGFATIFCFKAIKENKKKIQPRVSIVVGLLAFFALFPFKIGDFENRTSRLFSFGQVNQNSGALFYEDLIDQTQTLIDQHNIRNILTDSVTGFMLYAATKGELRHWLQKDYFPLRNSDYQTDLLTSDFTRHLLIVNKREPKISKAAIRSGHWISDTIRTSQYYPEDLETYLIKNQGKFSLVWQRNGILIYLIESKDS